MIESLVVCYSYLDVVSQAFQEFLEALAELVVRNRGIFLPLVIHRKAALSHC